MSMNIKNIMAITVFFMGVLLWGLIFEPVSAFAADTGIVSKIITKFNQNLSSYENVMLKYAKMLFYWCAVLEVAWLGVKAALGHNDIGETIKNFCISLMAAGFFLAVINNYHTWTWNILNGLKSVAGEATSLMEASDQPFTIGYNLAMQVFELCSWTSPGDSIAYILAGFAILFCFALITVQIILIKCECLICICAAAILLGLGATSFFREYAINVIRYIISVAFKLMTLNLLMGLGLSFFENMQIENEWGDIGVMICFCIVYYALAKTLPETIGGIISGSHAGNGGFSPASSAMKFAGGMALGAAAATVAGGMNVARAHQVARQSQGGTNPVSTMGALWNARNEAKNNRFHGARSEAETTIGGILKTQMAMGNMPKADTSTPPRAQVATGSTPAPAGPAGGSSGPQAVMGSTTNAGSATAPTAPKAQAATGGASNTLKKS